MNIPRSRITTIELGIKGHYKEWCYRACYKSALRLVVEECAHVYIRKRGLNPFGGRDKYSHRRLLTLSFDPYLDALIHRRTRMKAADVRKYLDKGASRETLIL